MCAEGTADNLLPPLSDPWIPAGAGLSQSEGSDFLTPFPSEKAEHVHTLAGKFCSVLGILPQDLVNHPPKICLTFNICVCVFVCVCIHITLEDTLFTMLRWFLPYINIKQPQANICPLPLEPPPSHPTLPLHPTEHQDELRTPHSTFPLAILCFLIYLFQCCFLNLHLLLSPLCPQFFLYVCVSIVALQICSSVPLL